MKKSASEIFQEYLQSRLEGREIPVEELVKRYPEHREYLLRKIAALEILPVQESAPQTDDLIGKEIRDFRIIKKIGSGGMGAVYLAEQISLKRNVALKFLHSSIFTNDKILERFRKEGLAIAKLEHKGIVPVYTVGELKGNFYIAMQHVRGLPLSKLIDYARDNHSTHIAPEKVRGLIANEIHDIEADKVETPKGKNWTEMVCSVIVAVSEAVEYAHRHNVIHRDIKPSNIILTETGQPVLLDFGLCKDLETVDITLTEELLGTPAYSSPEQLFGKSQLQDHRTDIYSLGITLYELLTFSLPYEGDSIGDLLSSIKSKEPRPPRKINKQLPKDLNTVILKAVDKNPNRRYKTVSDFKEDLIRFINLRPIKAKPPSFVYRSKQFLKRNRKAVLILILMLVLAFSYSGARLYKKYRKGYDLIKKTALSYFDQRYDTLIENLQEISVMFPQYPEISLVLGAFQTLTGRSKEGKKNIEHAMVMKEEKSTYLRMLIAYLITGDLDKTRTIVEAVDGTAYLMLSAAYLMEGNFDLAKNELARIKNRDALPYALKKTIAYLETAFDQMPQAMSTLQNTKGEEIAGLVKEPDQYEAYFNPSSQILFLINNALNDKMMAIDNIKELIASYPYRAMNYQLFHQLKISNKQKRILSKIKRLLGTTSFYSDEYGIEIQIPYGWLRYPMPKLYGNDVIAAYAGPPKMYKTLISNPIIMIGHNVKSKEILQDAYRFLDRVIIKFGGVTMKRYEEDVSNKKEEKYLITTEISTQLGELTAKVYVVVNGVDVYMVGGVARTSDFKYYDSDIMRAITSITFTKAKEWQVYSFPDNAFNIKMPSAPYYWEYFVPGMYPLKRCTFRSTDKGGSRYVVDSVTTPSRLTVLEKVQVLDYRLDLLSKAGKIINVEKNLTNGKFQYNVQLKSGKKISDIILFFEDNYYFRMGVDQNIDSYNKDNVIKYFSSFTPTLDQVKVLPSLF